MERDPKTDPQPDDEVERILFGGMHKKRRKVIYVSPLEVFYVDPKNDQQGRCSTTAWTDWCKTATIIKKA